MDGKSRRSGIRSYLSAAGVCALVTLLTLPLLGRVDLANIILLFVLAAAVIAAVWGCGPALLASFLSVACFNFFFVPPRFSFSVSNAEYLITLVVMLLVSLLISYLSNAYRQKALEAEQRAGDSALLHELAQVLSGALTFEHVAELLQGFVQHRFNTSTTLFLADRSEHLHAIGVEPNRINLVEQIAAQGVYGGGQATGAVNDLHEDVRTVLLPLNGATRRRGVMAVYVSDETQPLDESLLAALAALVTTAIERIHFVEVAQSSELEAQSVRLRSSILSAISHDVRTPLTSIYGLADSLASTDELPVAQQETALALRDQAYRLHRMVDNLLDMARLKSGRVTLKLDWQSVSEIVAASVQAIAPALSSHQLQIEWPQDMPLLKLDALLMERVFCNLLENAAKYSPPDTVITFGAEKHPQELAVWIDNVGSFPQDRKAHLFDLFERGEQESTIPGVGIGLSICRTIIDAHGGRIEALNHKGLARVLITLPCHDEPTMPAGEADYV
jgi:two-component system sensor histidine kinase KdpD